MIGSSASGRNRATSSDAASPASRVHSAGSGNPRLYLVRTGPFAGLGMWICRCAQGVRGYGSASNPVDARQIAYDAWQLHGGGS